MEENEKEEDKDSKKKKKEKKEKKPKEPKEPKGPTKIDIMTTHLNLSDRDDKNINTEIDVSARTTRAGVSSVREVLFILSQKFLSQFSSCLAAEYRVGLVVWQWVGLT